ncbi:hypothetical protein [uncultured Mucilaginibacter sp.]|uniref:hypothetical protein n=1 Tax=uncultured Mucilaginibacter sp. TaxID=797541 RepID=UPI0025FDFCE2|nr:hypothetical protein [uncultured Mucilaginibacter sp.]
MEINTNYKNISSRIFLLIIFSILLFLIVFYGIIKNGQQPLYIVAALISWLYVGLLISVFGVLKVQIDEFDGKWTFIRIVSKKEIDSGQISRYYKSVYNTRKGSSYGIIIELGNSKLIELNPGNLDKVMQLEQYLKTLKIEFAGEKKSFYPFTSAL